MIPPEDTPDMMAAELALDLLEGDARAAAVRRMLAEPGFARDVDRWRAHFATLFAAVPEVAPPADGLARLERALADPAPTPVIAANEAAVRAVRLWQGISAVALAIAASLLLVITLRPGAPPPGPVTTTPQVAVNRPAAVLIAQIAPVKEGGTIGAVFDPATGTLRVAPAIVSDAQHSAELWVIGGDGTPHSLGLLSREHTISVALKPDNRARIAAGATLAISIEPIGGAPGGKPTGPVVATGALALV